MDRYDARKEIFDTLALFSSGRIQRESVPKGFYCYEVRHDDECMGDDWGYTGNIGMQLESWSENNM